MKEQLKLIIDKLNQEPFNLNLTLVELDNKSTCELLWILNTIFSSFEKNPNSEDDCDDDDEQVDDSIFHFSSSNQNIRELSTHIIKCLMILKCNLFSSEFEKDRDLLIDRLVSSSQDNDSSDTTKTQIMYPLLYWSLSNYPTLKKRAYLAQYLMPMEIPQRPMTGAANSRPMSVMSSNRLNMTSSATSRAMSSMGSVVSVSSNDTGMGMNAHTLKLLQDYKELQTQFKNVHKEYESTLQFYLKQQQQESKEGNVNLLSYDDLQYEIKTLTKEKKELMDKITHMKQKYASSEKMVNATRKLRMEREKEISLQNQKENLFDGISLMKQKKDWFVQKFTFFQQQLHAFISGSDEEALTLILQELQNQISEKTNEVELKMLEEKMGLQDRLNHLLHLSRTDKCDDEMNSVLQDDLQVLQNQKEVLVKGIKELDERHSDSDNTSGASDRFVMLRQHVLSSDTKCTQLQKTLETKEKEMLFLKKKLNVLEPNVNSIILKSSSQQHISSDKNVDINKIGLEMRQKVKLTHSLQSDISQLESDILSLENTHSSLQKQHSKMELHLSSSEQKAGLSGLRGIQNILKENSQSMGNLDFEKTKTLEDIAQIVEQIGRALEEKKEFLKPLIKELKENRHNFQLLREKHKETKRTYDLVVQKHNSDLNEKQKELLECQQIHQERKDELSMAQQELGRKEFECDKISFEIEWKNMKENNEVEQIDETKDDFNDDDFLSQLISKYKNEWKEQEKQYQILDLLLRDTSSRKSLHSLKDVYLHKISTQESQSKTLRKLQIQYEKNEEDVDVNNKQKEYFSELQFLLKAKQSSSLKRKGRGIMRDNKMEKKKDEERIDRDNLFSGFNNDSQQQQQYRNHEQVLSI